MIALFTDFGLDGLYVGQMHAVIGAAAPHIGVVDLCHTIPVHNIRTAAYLLPAYTRYLPPASITICVVDPGVGGHRPHALCRADGRWFIGPDNGQFDVLAQHAVQFRKYHFQWPGQVSNSFHGRDIYSPAACLLAASGDPETLQCQPAPEAPMVYPADLHQIIYFDRFGNALSGCRRMMLPQDAQLMMHGKLLEEAGTFSDVEAGSCFWYENANGLVELAVNMGSCRQVLDLKLGDCFELAT